MYDSAISLHDRYGHRKYLNQRERLRFLESVKLQNRDKRLFCLILYYTGARISEVHNLTFTSIDFENKSIVLGTLKRRKKGVYREIPIPNHLLDELGDYIQSFEHKPSVWIFSLRTASRYIKRVMNDANISGPRSCARGLRHGFAVHAVQKVPLTIVQKWLGHASLKTTAIYLEVIGEEERELASRLW